MGRLDFALAQGGRHQKLHQQPLSLGVKRRIVATELNEEQLRARSGGTHEHADNFRESVDPNDPAPCDGHRKRWLNRYRSSTLEMYASVSLWPTVTSRRAAKACVRASSMLVLKAPI